MNKIKSFYKAFEDRFRGPRELILERLKVYLPLIEPLKSLYPDNRAIDLGCGRGEWLQLIDSNGFKAHGVDIDEAMVENAKEFGLSVELRDALEYLKSLSDNSVSIVTAFHLAEHISFDTLQGLIIESLRVLKPAGLMILETPNPENVAVGSSTFYLDPTHLKPLPLAFLSYLPEYYGFARVNVFRLNGTVIDDSNISLLSIINGVSPDYSVIAQKKASPSMLKEFDGEFYKKLGVSLEELAIRYEQMRHVQQEQEVAAQLLVIQKREDQEKAKQFQQLQIEAHQIAAEQARVYTERERTLHQNIQNAQQALHDREKEWSDREKELISLISQSDNKRLQESADLMRALAEREQEFGERQLQAMQAAEQEKAETLRMHAEREGTLQQQLADLMRALAEREQEFGERQLQAMQAAEQEKAETLRMHAEREGALQQQLADLMRALAEREQEFGERQLQAMQAAEQEKAETLRMHAEREGALQQQLADLMRALAEREQEFGERQLQAMQAAEQEKAETLRMHAEREGALQQQLADLMRALAEREQEFGERQLQAMRAAEQEKAETLRMHAEREGALQQQLADLMRALAEREQEFGERQLQAMRAAEQEKAETLRMHAEREGTWHYELDQHLQLLQKQCDDLLAQHQRLEQFRQAANAVEVNLKQQLQTERQTVMQIQQVIDSLNGELYDIRSSFSWLLTAPFRKLVGLFKTVEPLTAAATSTRVMFVHIPIEPSNQFFTSRHQLIRMDNVGKSTSTFRDNVTTASTLDELISFHDEQFVRCAYQAVLGRTPDSEGLDYYLHRLRTGVPKIQILAQLRLSEEGKAHAAQVSGLDPAIQRYQRGRYPLIGWMFRLLNDAESNHPIENKIRSIENQLYVLNAGLCQCVTQQIKSAAVGGEPFISGHASVAKTSALDEVINASRQNGENASPSDLHIDTVLQCIREEIKSVAVGGEPFISGHASVAKTSALDEVINASRQNGENASRGDLHISAVLQCIREEIKSVAVGGEPFISGHASVAKTSALDEVINASRQNGENASRGDLHIETILQRIREEIKNIEP